MKRETRLLFNALVSPRDAHDSQKPWRLQNPLHYWYFLSSSLSGANVSCSHAVTSLPDLQWAGVGPTGPTSKINRTFLHCLRHLFHPPLSPCIPFPLPVVGRLLYHRTAFPKLLSSSSSSSFPPPRSRCSLHVWNKPGCVCCFQAASQHQQQKRCS